MVPKIYKRLYPLIYILLIYRSEMHEENERMLRRKLLQKAWPSAGQATLEENGLTT
jgi:hypothetical protein